MLGTLIATALAAPTVGMVAAPHHANVQLSQTVLPTKTIGSFTMLEGGAPLYRTDNRVFGVGASAQASALGVFVPSEERAWFGPQSGSVAVWALLRSDRLSHGIGIIGHLGAQREGLYAVVAHPRTTGATIGYRLSARASDTITLGGDIDAGINGTTLVHVAASPWIKADLGRFGLHARLTAGLPQRLGAVSAGASVELGRLDVAAMAHTMVPLLGEAPAHVMPQLTVRYVANASR